MPVTFTGTNKDPSLTRYVIYNGRNKFYDYMKQYIDVIQNTLAYLRLP
jgi:hypothetical protein